MERRKFIKNIGLSVGTLMLTPNLFGQTQSKKQLKKITILHTNDTHSNIDSFPSNHPLYPNQGGVSKRFELIQKIRNEEDNVILLDAGDVFQGTPYFNLFGGVLEMKMMTELGYDVATLGNHDFDIGVEGFIKAQKYANFPFVNANYDFTNSKLKNQIKPYSIIQKGNVKIGVFGIGIELNGLVPVANFEGVVYQDPILIANQITKELKNQKCDLIICLSHLGFEYQTDKISDKILAKETENIDIIIGGHTHTILEKPFVTQNKNQENVIINQVGWAGLFLGRIDVEIHQEHKLFKNSKNKLEII